MDRTNWVKGRKRKKIKFPRPPRHSNRVAVPVWASFPTTTMIVVTGILANVVIFSITYPKLYVLAYVDTCETDINWKNCFWMVPWAFVTSFPKAISILGGWIEEDGRPGTGNTNRSNHWIVRFNNYLHDVVALIPWLRNVR